MNRILFFISVVFLSCNQDAEKKAGPAKGVDRTMYSVTNVEGIVVRPVALSESITASGTIIPEEETELHPESTGRVVTINLPEGKVVRKGTLLLKIFDEDLQTQLRKIEIQLKQAEITEKRLGDLLRVKGVSQQEYDLAVLEVQNLRSEIELIRINIAKTELRAPYDGIIGLRRISPGAYVTPATAVASIRASANLKIDFSIPERYGILLKPGQTVSFKVEGQPDPFTAIVLATEQRISEDTRNLLVRGQVRGAQNKLLPGTFAEVSLTLRNKPQALMVPSQALIPEAREKKLIVSRGGKAEFVVVKTGIRQSGNVEITEGLTVGDTVAVTGILFLRPGSPIQFSKVD